MKWHAFYLFFVVLAVPDVARTQDLDIRTEEPWEAPWDSSAQWDSGLWSNQGRMTLDLKAGRRSILRPEQVQFALAGRTTVEHYFLAQLRLPLDFFLGLAGGASARARTLPLARLPESGQEAEELAEADQGPSSRAGRAPLSLEAQESGVPPSFQPAGDRRHRHVSTGGSGVPSASELTRESTEVRASVDRPGQAADALTERPRSRGPSQRETEASAQDAPLPHSFVREVLDRAVSAQGGPETLARLQSLARRSRASGLLPELRVRGVGGFDRVQSLDSDGLLPADTSQRDGSDSLLELRLTFHLERLLVGDEEAGVERLRSQVQKNVQETQDEVLTILLDWDEARRQSSRLDLQPDELADVRLRCGRLAVILDVRTGGWFRGGAALADFAAQGAPRAVARPLGSASGGR